MTGKHNKTYIIRLFLFDMETKEMQKAVDNWFKDIGEDYWSPRSILLQMMEEVGELAREVNNNYGDRPRKEGEEESERKISKELGDILFTAVCLANKLGLDLGECFEIILEKNKIRDKDRHSKS